MKQEKVTVPKDMFLFLEDCEDLFSPAKKTVSTIDVSLDTEYKDRQFLTAQLYIPEWNEKIMVFNSRLHGCYPEHKDRIESLKRECLMSGNCTKVLSLDLEDDKAYNIVTVLETISKEKGVVLKSLNINLLMFFAINKRSFPYVWIQQLHRAYASR